MCLGNSKRQHNKTKPSMKTKQSMKTLRNRHDDILTESRSQDVIGLRSSKLLISNQSPLRITSVFELWDLGFSLS